MTSFAAYFVARFRRGQVPPAASYTCDEGERIAHVDDGDGQIIAYRLPDDAITMSSFDTWVESEFDRASVTWLEGDEIQRPRHDQR